MVDSITNVVYHCTTRFKAPAPHIPAAPFLITFAQDRAKRTELSARTRDNAASVNWHIHLMWNNDSHNYCNANVELIIIIHTLTFAHTVGVRSRAHLSVVE